MAPDPLCFVLMPFGQKKDPTGKPDYWDYATLLELAVLANDHKEAKRILASTLISICEIWEPKTTANNLRLIREARQKRGRAVDWLDELIDTLEKANIAQ